MWLYLGQNKTKKSEKHRGDPTAQVTLSDFNKENHINSDKENRSLKISLIKIEKMQFLSFSTLEHVMINF